MVGGSEGGCWVGLDPGCLWWLVDKELAGNSGEAPLLRLREPKNRHAHSNEECPEGLLTAKIKRERAFTLTPHLEEYAFLNRLLSNLQTVKMIKKKTKARIYDPYNRSTVLHLICFSMFFSLRSVYTKECVDILGNREHNVKLVSKE